MMQELKVLRIARSMRLYFKNEQEQWPDCKIPEIVIIEGLCCLKEMFSNILEPS